MFTDKMKQAISGALVLLAAICFVFAFVKYDSEIYVSIAWLGGGVMLLLIAIIAILPVSTTVPTNFAALIYSLLTEHILRTILLGFIVILSVLILFFVVPILLKTELLVEIKNDGVIIHSGFRKTQSLQFVHPIGWQQTALELKKDQIVKINTSGQITIGFTEYYWDLLSQRMNAEKENKCLQLDKLRRPFIQFNLMQGDCKIKPLDNDQDIKLKWEWIGPEGYTNQVKDSDTLLAPSVAIYGRLVGYISESKIGQREKETNSVIDIGPNSTFTANKDGTLYLAINDSRMSLKDNLGYFVVTLEVE